MLKKINSIITNPQLPDAAVFCKDETFWLRAANKGEERNQASALIERRYSWRGYETNSLEDIPTRMTLCAFNSEETMVGTITVQADSATIGLSSDKAFRDITDSLRKKHVLSEFGALALEENISPSVLASLFHAAFIFVVYKHQASMILIEVNPRHVRFYQRSYGFELLANTRTCDRVNAPAVLMGASVAKIYELLEKFKNKENTRSLYPFFFTLDEEKGIAKRLFGDML
jgi:hypothetical protein